MNKIAWLIYFLLIFSPLVQAKVAPSIKIALKGSVVVRIPGQSLGSGFAFHRDLKRKRTLIATNDHVCQTTRGFVFLSSEIDYTQNLNTYPMEIADYQDNKYKAWVVYTTNIHNSKTPRSDLCILETTARLPIIKLGAKPEIGEAVFNVSAPRGFWPLVYSGFAGKEYFGGTKRVSSQAFTLYLNSGSSGSAVFNERGDAVAVVFAIDLAEPDIRVPIITWGVPIQKLKNLKKRYYKAREK